MKLTREQLAGLSKILGDSFVILEGDDMDGGIVGLDLSGTHPRLVYDIDETCKSMAEARARNLKEQDPGVKPDLEALYEDAVEWVDYNTLRSLPYWEHDPETAGRVPHVIPSCANHDLAFRLALTLDELDIVDASRDAKTKEPDSNEF